MFPSLPPEINAKASIALIIVFIILIIMMIKNIYKDLKENKISKGTKMMFFFVTFLIIIYSIPAMIENYIVMRNPSTEVLEPRNYKERF